jgi:hypothetical protein
MYLLRLLADSIRKSGHVIFFIFVELNEWFYLEKKYFNVMTSTSDFRIIMMDMIHEVLTTSHFHYAQHLAESRGGRRQEYYMHDLAV